MPTYSFAQLEQVWIQGGGSKAVAPLAAAIAMAESSGRSDVTSSNPDGGVNVGFWQLDTRGKGAGYSVAQLQDPVTNARVAVHGSSDGRDWSAWQTFVQGTYRKFLPSGYVAPAAIPGGTAASSGGGGGLLGWPQDITGFFKDADHALSTASHVALALFQPSTYIRAAVGGLAVILLGVGLFALYRASAASS